MINLDYKKQYTFEHRLNESTKIINKYPDRIPVICELTGNNIELLDKKKYLVPNNITLGQFIIVLRKRLNITKEQAIFCFINNKIPIISCDMATLYKENKDNDGFLYIYYSGENCFGCKLFNNHCFNSKNIRVTINRLFAINFFDITSKKFDVSIDDISDNNISDNDISDNDINVNNKLTIDIAELPNELLNELPNELLNELPKDNMSSDYNKNNSDDEISDFEII